MDKTILFTFFLILCLIGIYLFLNKTEEQYTNEDKFISNKNIKTSTNTKSNIKINTSNKSHINSNIKIISNITNNEPKHEFDDIDTELEPEMESDTDTDTDIETELEPEGELDEIYDNLIFRLTNNDKKKINIFDIKIYYLDENNKKKLINNFTDIKSTKHDDKTKPENCIGGYSNDTNFFVLTGNKKDKKEQYIQATLPKGITSDKIKKIELYGDLSLSNSNIVFYTNKAVLENIIYLSNIVSKNIISTSRNGIILNYRKNEWSSLGNNVWSSYNNVNWS